MMIDAFEFARRSQEASGTVEVRDLRRLEVVPRGDRLEWDLAGSTDERGRPFLDLEVRGAVHLVCQRCLQPVRIETDLVARFLLAASEAEADAVPLEEDAFDVVVGAREFDVEGLVEDEVILWLPLVPKHERCPEPLPSTEGATLGDGKVSPFAALGKMKKERG